MTIFSVTNAVELTAALKAAHGGDQVSLAAGDYGDMIFAKLNFASDVTISSADPDAPASFHAIKVSAVNNLVFDGIVVDFQPNMETISSDSAVRISLSTGVSFVNSSITGGPAINGVPEDTPAGGLDSTGNVIGLPVGRAITIIDCADITIAGNEISQFFKGIVPANVDGLVIRDNEIHDLRGSPFTGGNLDDVLIEGNHFSDFHPWQLGGSGDHGDFVHIWTVPNDQDGPSRNITITDNFFEQGLGQAFLGIYLDDNGNGLGFVDVLIQNNVIFNGDAQGLRLENVSRSTVAYNTLLQSSGDTQDGPGIVLAQNSRDIAIHHNILAGDPGAIAPDADGNVRVQRFDELAANYYGNLFVDALTRNSDLPGLQIRPGSALDGVAVGADASQFDRTPDALTALITNRPDAEDGFSVSLDGLLTADHRGFVSADGATFAWDFGDGTTAKGAAVDHRFDTPGSYDVVLRVEHGGVVDEAHTTVVIFDPVIIDLDLYTNGARDISGYLSSVLGGMLGSGQQAHSVLSGYHLSDGADFNVARADAPRLFGLDEFTLSFSFKRDSADSATGDIMRIHGSWYVLIEKTGELTFRYDDVANHTFKVTTTDAGITDAKWHSIDLAFDSEAGIATFYVDGREVGSGEIGGRTQSVESWGLSIGNPFGASADGMVGSVRVVDDALGADLLGGGATQKAMSVMATSDMTSDHASALPADPANLSGVDLGADEAHAGVVAGYSLGAPANDVGSILDLDGSNPENPAAPVDVAAAGGGLDWDFAPAHSIGGNIADAFAELGGHADGGRSDALFAREPMDFRGDGGDAFALGPIFDHQLIELRVTEMVLA